MQSVTKMAALGVALAVARAEEAQAAWYSDEACRSPLSSGGSGSSLRFPDAKLPATILATWKIVNWNQYTGQEGTPTDDLDQWVVSGAFTASLSGSWASRPLQLRYTWSGEGSSTADNPQLYIIRTTVGQQSLLKQSVVQVTVQDPLDNASGSDKYTVNWHLPAENVVEDTSKLVSDSRPSIIEPYSFNAGQVAGHNMMLDAQFRFGQGWWMQDGVAGAGAALQLVSNLDKPDPELVILYITGQYLSSTDLGLTESGGVQNTETAWNESVKHPGLVDGDATYANSVMYHPLLVQHWDDHWLDYDVYGAHGYNGRGSKIRRSPQEGFPKAAGHFKVWRTGGNL